MSHLGVFWVTYTQKRAGLRCRPARTYRSQEVGGGGGVCLPQPTSFEPLPWFRGGPKILAGLGRKS